VVSSGVAEAGQRGIARNPECNYDPTKQALNALHRELMDLNPSTSASLADAIAEEHGQY
jgi:hypothetical protein